MSSITWNKQSRTIKLGPLGLKLSIVRPNERKNASNQNISLENMKKVRFIPKDTLIDLSKVKLSVDFGTCHVMPCANSKVILDKAKFWIEPTECPIRTICSEGAHILYINHNKVTIKQGTKLQLQLNHKTEFEDIVIPQTVLTSKLSLIKPGQIKFKVNMSDSIIQNLLNENTKGAFKVEVEVFVDDEDAMRFGENDDKSLIEIKVETD